MVQIQTHYPSFPLLQEPKALWDERNLFKVIYIVVERA